MARRLTPLQVKRAEILRNITTYRDTLIQSMTTTILPQYGITDFQAILNTIESFKNLFFDRLPSARRKTDLLKEKVHIFLLEVFVNQIQPYTVKASYIAGVMLARFQTNPLESYSVIDLNFTHLDYLTSFFIFLLCDQYHDLGDKGVADKIKSVLNFGVTMFICSLLIMSGCVLLTYKKVFLCQSSNSSINVCTISPHSSGEYASVYNIVGGGLP